jgi:hypothetical protein
MVKVIRNDWIMISFEKIRNIKMSTSLKFGIWITVLALNRNVNLFCYGNWKHI